MIYIHLNIDVDLKPSSNELKKERFDLRKIISVLPVFALLAAYRYETKWD
jgi:hypothetical protein